MAPIEKALGLSRRKLLRLAMFATGAGAAGVIMAACDPATRERIANRPIRKEINSAAAAADLTTLANAITAMKALPSSDRRNWDRQVALHGTSPRHHSWLFLPWHRAYLFYFEEICRELTGTDTFALPYWNWTTNPTIPVAFTTGTLFYPGRTASGPALASIVGTANINLILSETNFLVFAGSAVPLNDASQNLPLSFQSPLEAGPHNYIHGYVGGDMAFSFATAPKDPLFWMHHNRVDELWAQWNINRNNPNTSNGDWTNTTFTEFCDRHGAPATISVIATVLLPYFTYRYDSLVLP
jgi:tyrosinase